MQETIGSTEEQQSVARFAEKAYLDIWDRALAPQDNRLCNK